MKSSMSNFNANAYAILSQIYDDAGFANYAAHITPEVLTYIQQHGWLGRSILDLGCGTGASTSALAQRGFNVTAIDQSPEMLKAARMRVEGTGYLAELVEGDMTSVDYPGGMDLVCCFGNAINDLRSLRDIEAVFQKAFNALQPERRLAIDMLTLYGLGEYLKGEQIIDISDSLYMTVHNTFHYDTMTLRQSLVIFQRQLNGAWVRHNVFLTLRGFPVAKVVEKMEQVGFKVLSVLDTQLKDYQPDHDREGRVIIIGEKPV
jgi:SAM-dependent methyltransferase